MVWDIPLLSFPLLPLIAFWTRPGLWVVKESLDPCYVFTTPMTAQTFRTHLANRIDPCRRFGLKKPPHFAQSPGISTGSRRKRVLLYRLSRSMRRILALVAQEWPVLIRIRLGAVCTITHGFCQMRKFLDCTVAEAQPPRYFESRIEWLVTGNYLYTECGSLTHLRFIRL